MKMLSDLQRGCQIYEDVRILKRLSGSQTGGQIYEDFIRFVEGLSD
jgi:hypothetical protein